MEEHQEKIPSKKRKNKKSKTEEMEKMKEVITKEAALNSEVVQDNRKDSDNNI